MSHEPPATELRCKRCNRLLMKARLMPGTWVQVKCPKCDHLQELQVKREAA